MADTIRGDGVYRAISALSALVEDPERLARERERFSGSPPPYRTHSSHNSTPPQNPDSCSEEQIAYAERKWQLIREYRASFTWYQFKDELVEETKRVEEASLNRTCSVPIGKTFDEVARENVKTRWVEQGIWNEKWKDSEKCGWKWKHEEPFELESESEADPAAEGESSLFCPPPERAEAKPRRPKSAEELQWSAERRLVREREREASRPFHQFVYQVSKERERIQDEMNPPKMPAPRSFDPNRTCYGSLDYQAVLLAMATDSQIQDEPKDEPNEERATAETPRDINSTAYERVKKTWMKKGIWNKKWGVLPGMSWKHEQPLEEMLREELGDPPTPVQASPPCDNAEQVPPRSIFSAPLPTESNASPVQASPRSYHSCETVEGLPWSISGVHLPVESNSRQASTIRNASQQEPPADTILGVLESHGYETGGAPSGPVTGSLNLFMQDLPPATDPEELLNSAISHPSAASNPRHSTRMEARRPALSQGRRSEDGQSPKLACTTLSSVHSTKVSKSRRKCGPDQQLRPNASQVRSEAHQSSPGLDVPALPTAATPAPLRRSKRLQEAARNGGSQSRPRQTSADPKPSRSARPQGVSKRRPSTARRKAK